MFFFAIEKQGVGGARVLYQTQIAVGNSSPRLQNLHFGSDATYQRRRLLYI